MNYCPEIKNDVVILRKTSREVALQENSGLFVTFFIVQQTLCLEKLRQAVQFNAITIIDIRT
jgi:hypothetical protein